MADAVVRLQTVPVDEDLKQRSIVILEQMLAEAKKGRGFDQVFCVATLPDSTRVRYAWTRGTSVTDVLGKLEYLKWQLVDACNEDG